jgi:hypothetical protein
MKLGAHADIWLGGYAMLERRIAAVVAIIAPRAGGTEGDAHAKRK